MGEWNQYGHPKNRCISSLINVPWVVIPSEERRNIVKEDNHEQVEAVNHEKIEERLRTLGYKK